LLTKALRALSSISSNKLLLTGALLTSANVLGGLLGYVYQILMGRFLSLEGFALFSAVMSLYVFFSAPLTATFMVISRRVTALVAKNQAYKLLGLYRAMIIGMLGVGCALLFIGFGLLSIAQEYLKSSFSGPVWFFYILLALTMVLVINNAFFQGLQKFYYLSLLALFGIVLKIVFSFGLVTNGNGASGALAGVALATLAIIIIGCCVIYKFLITQHAPVVVNIPSAISIPSLNILPVLVANLGFVAITQLDMVLVNWYFPSNQSALYAATSVMGKAILYLPGGIVLALFPMVAKNHSNNINSVHLIRYAGIATIVMCALVATVYWFFGDWLMHFFYGEKYLDGGFLLRWYGIAIFPMALLMVAEHFLIAQGKTIFCWAYLLILPIQFLTLSFWHQELWMVLLNIGVGGMILTVVAYGILFWTNPVNLREI